MNEMTLTPEKLDELERLADLATPGPWVKNHLRFGYSIWAGHPRYPTEEVVGTIDEDGRYGAIEKEADADLIAALDPATVRELVRLARIGLTSSGESGVQRGGRAIQWPDGINTAEMPEDGAV